MKVYISGYGIISAIGDNINRTLNGLQKAEIEPSKVSVFQSEIDNPVFEVKNFNQKKYFEDKRTASLLLHTVHEALERSELSKINLNKYRVGVCIGTTVACQLNDIEFYKNFKENNYIDKSSLRRYLKGNLAQIIKDHFNLTGPALTIVNACTSGSDAIGTAAMWVKCGICDIAIAGGADEINKIPLTGFSSLSNMSSERCRPFDKNRSGLNIGEGAGAVIIESAESLRNRRVISNTFLSAYYTATDAYHLTAPSPEGNGLKKAITNALLHANIDPDHIAFINAHGTATRDNDITEGKVFKELFDKDIKFLSTKGFTGHTLGAAGAIEAIFTIMSLEEKWIPKNYGFEVYDEEIGLAPVSKVTEIGKSAAISTSLAFGGNNSVLIFQNERSS